MDATPIHPVATRRRALRLGGAAALTASLVATTLVASGSTPASAGSLPVATRLVSRDSAGATVKGVVNQDLAISDNGRFVAFTTNVAIVAADTNAKRDVYVRDQWAGTTELVSQTDGEQPTNGDSLYPSISDDGRFVAFLSDANNLVPNDDKGLKDVFLRDRFEGTTRWLSPNFSGGLLNAPVNEVALSGDATAVAFTTNASTVVGNDTNSKADVFVRDSFGTFVERASVDSVEGQAAEGGTLPQLSDDGRYVAFISGSTLAGGKAGTTNVYRRDRTDGLTTLVNIRNGGGVSDDGAGGPSMSGDGRYVSYGSNATDVVTGDTNGSGDTFIRDMTSSSVVRASLSDSDAQLAKGAATGAEGLSDDGKKVVFASLSRATSATDVGGDGTNATEDYDVFIRDTAAGTTRRISVGPSDPDPNAQQVGGITDGSGTMGAYKHQLKITGESFDQVYVNGPVDLGPFPTSSAAIGPQFQDFLGRSATAAETSAWSTRFAKAQGQLPALIASLAVNPAFSGNRAPLIRLYWAFFLRRPDASGLTYWLGKYQSGSSLTKIAQSFASSSEFKTRYGTLSNQQYVQKVYQNVFQRQPDPGGLSYWTGKLDSKALTRGAVLVQFSESSEGKRRLAGPTNITLVSLGMLRTTPTAAQWDLVYEPVSLGEPQSLVFVAHEFLATAQYQARYQ